MIETSGNRESIVSGLVGIGERGIGTQDDAALDAYFADDFVFHGPDGDADLVALKALWGAMREAFTGFTVTRGHIVVEGDFVAAQTTMAGTFDEQFTQSPVGPLPPTGRPFALHLLNIFRYDGTGRLAEEWAQYDNRDLLHQLGVAVQ